MGGRAWPVFAGYGVMTRIGRYWLFFVIVAVGLALSWGQIGQKTQRVLEAEDVTYLNVEPRCFANQRPCAAIAGDHALVLGPAQLGLRLKQTGFPPDEIVAVEALRLNEPEGLALRVIPEASSWQILWSPQSGDAVRVRLIGNGRVTVADFPIEDTGDGQ